MRIFISIVLFLCAAIVPAQACSCIWPDNMTVKKHFEQTDVVFRGVFIGAKSFESEEYSILDRVGKFQVLEVLKGDIGAMADVYYPEDSGANCGLSFGVGDEYEVFAGIDDQGRIGTTDCSGTRNACARSEWSWDDYRKVAKKN
ncbi:hypothetical protein ACFOOP_08750 [Marinicaulis aureus]|uniref:Tissue inhibitor of metalloproteinase n=1 Tax=Hyphococcus aureus TaxID=2666033 RepID=A0ABW1KUD2_9PROT